MSKLVVENLSRTFPGVHGGEPGGGGGPATPPGGGPASRPGKASMP